MIRQIGSTGIPGITGPESGKQSNEPQGASFREILKESLKKVNDLQAQKSGKIEELVTNKEADIDEVLIAVEEANLAFEFTMQVRNKLIEAYRELMRMQV